MKKRLLGKSLSGAALISLFSACATMEPQLPDYDPSLPAVSQMDNFIDAENEEYMEGVKRIGVMSCNVMFGMTSSASAATSGGFRAGATRATGTTSRSDVKISVTYSTSGLEEAELQILADTLCEDTENHLASSGFELVPNATIRANKHFQDLHAGGRASPFEYKGNGGTRYLVLARTGETVSDPRYIGTASGLAQAFKSISGDAAEQHEDYLIKDLQMTGVNINLLVDFASLQSDGNSRMGGFANKDTARVDASVQLAVGGDMRFQPLNKQDCWEEWGKEKCMIKPQHQPIFSSKRLVATTTPFYSNIEEVTTTADQVTSGLTQAIGFLSALGGTSSSVARDITRYQVNVIPDIYKSETRSLATGLVNMATSKARTIQ